MDSNSEPKKAQVCLGIQTRPGQTKYHRSTACATAMALEGPSLLATAVLVSYRLEKSGFDLL